MTSKFTSRFRRRHEVEASNAPANETVAVPTLETQDTKTEQAEGGAAGAPKVEALPEAVKSEVAMAEATPEPNKPEASEDKVAVVKPAPARLVEIEKPKAGRPEPEPIQPKSWLSNAHAYRVPAAAAAALVAALLTGYGIGASGQVREAASYGKSAALLETTAKDLREANGQIVQLAAELKSIKGAVEGMKGERDKSRGEVLGKQAQLSEKLERTGQENATRIGRLAEQLDRIEKIQRDSTRQVSAEKTEKADKPEKVAAAPLPPAKPNLDPAHTGSLGDTKPAEAKPDPRKTPLDGYVVRDYDDGYALIETRSGRYIDVAVGYTLPGIGKVEAIERRGRQWVVVTPKGYIGER